jgi:hypothetical protein
VKKLWEKGRAKCNWMVIGFMTLHELLNYNQSTEQRVKSVKCKNAPQ